MQRRTFLFSGVAMASVNLAGCKNWLQRFQVLDIAEHCQGETAAAASQVVQRKPLEKRSEPLVVNADQKDVVISNMHFRDITDDGDYAIHIRGSGINEPLRVRVENCLFENVRWAIRVDFAHDVTIRGNRFVNCGQAVRASTSTKVKVDYNEFESIGTLEVLNHGYGKYWAQNAVNFIEVQGCGNSVSYNLFEYGNKPAPYLEDIVSLWNSGGIAESMLQVVGNKFRGGTPGSNTGAGIVAGDAVGAKTLYASHIRIADNILVRTQNIGIGIAGGHDMEVVNNKVYIPLEHSGKLTKHPHHNENNSRAGGGIMIFDYSKTNECHTILVENNAAFATRADNVANAWWTDKETCWKVTDRNNQWESSTVAPNGLGEDLLAKHLFADLPLPYFSSAVKE